jgi:hypothetical protein
MDFTAYPAWNPVLRKIEGVAHQGEHLRVHFHLPGTRPVVLRSRVARLHVGRELVWVGYAFSPGLLSGMHSFIVEPLAEGKTQFVQRQALSGLLVPLLWPMLRTRARRACLLMNSALKAAVEHE